MDRAGSPGQPGQTAVHSWPPMPTRWVLPRAEGPDYLGQVISSGQ